MLREEGPTADIPLPDWIQRARYSLTKDEYAEIAVAVALELTSHLCAVVGANANAHVSSYNGSANGKAYGSSHSDQHFLSPLVKINDITAENVVVSVAHDATDVLGANLLPTRVHINLEHSNLTDAFDDRPLTKREVCFALGRTRQDLNSKFGIQAEINIDSFVKLMTCQEDGRLKQEVDVMKSKAKLLPEGTRKGT